MAAAPAILPPAYLPVVEAQCEKLKLGRMNVRCSKCDALHWKCEELSKSTVAHPVFGTCCIDGKVKIPPLEKPPLELWHLYNGTSPDSKHFLSHITSYNNAFSMVSMSHKRIIHGGGPDVFTIQGELWHQSGSLLPEPGRVATYAQVYFQTNEEQLDLRMVCANGNQDQYLSVPHRVLQDSKDS